MTLPLLPVASFQSVLHFFENGGVFMYFLAVCSVVSVAVIVLRALALRRALVVPPFIEREIESIQPGDAVSAHPVDVGERAPQQHLAIRLHGEGRDCAIGSGEAV